MGCNDVENTKDGEDDMGTPGTTSTMETTRMSMKMVDDIEGGAWETSGTMLMMGMARTAARVVDDVEGGAWETLQQLCLGNSDSNLVLVEFEVL